MVAMSKTIYGLVFGQDFRCSLSHNEKQQAIGCIYRNKQYILYHTGNFEKKKHVEFSTVFFLPHFSNLRHKIFITGAVSGFSPRLI